MREKMNILFLCEGYNFAGSESYTLNLTSELSLCENLKLYYAVFFNHLFKVRMEQNGAKVFSLHGRDYWNSIKRIRNLVRDLEISAVHCTDLRSTLAGGVATIFLPNVKTIATVHGLPEGQVSFVKGIKNRLALFLYFFLLRFHIDSVICVSSDLVLRLKNKIGPRKVNIVRNGLRGQETPRVRATKRTSHSCCILGTVGRLEIVKGHAILLAAASELEKAGKDFLLHIVGNGPLEEQLRNRSVQLGINSRTRFWGFRDDALAIMSQMDIFLLPSYHEGIPYVLLEAMALSKAVVCSNVGGIKEVIEDQVDGILVSPGDPTALRKAILRLIEEPDFAALLGQNARKKVVTQFSSINMATKTNDIYVRLIRNN